MNIFHFAHHFHTRAIARAGFFTHEQNYYNIYSQTQLGDIVHEQTIICKQLFAGLVLGSRPMKNSRNKYSRKGFTLRDPTTQCFHIRQKCLKWFFYAFQTCLVHLELPSKLFIYLDVFRRLWSSPKF